MSEWACEKCAPQAFLESHLHTVVHRGAGLLLRTLTLVWLAAALAARVPRSHIGQLTIPGLVGGIVCFLLSLAVMGLLFWSSDYSKAIYTWGSLVPTLLYGIFMVSIFGGALYLFEPARPFLMLALTKLIQLLIPGAG